MEHAKTEFVGKLLEHNAKKPEEATSAIQEFEPAPTDDNDCFKTPDRKMEGQNQMLSNYAAKTFQTCDQAQE